MRYIVIRINPLHDTAVQVGEEFNIIDEPAAYRLALSKALEAVGAIRGAFRKDNVSHQEELAAYNRAGTPLRDIVLDHDKMIRRVLSDLNTVFRQYHHATYAVVEVKDPP